MLQSVVETHLSLASCELHSGDTCNFHQNSVTSDEKRWCCWIFSSRVKGKSKRKFIGDYHSTLSESCCFVRHLWLASQPSTLPHLSCNASGSPHSTAPPFIRLTTISVEPYTQCTAHSIATSLTLQRLSRRNIFNYQNIATLGTIGTLSTVDAGEFTTASHCMKPYRFGRGHKDKFPMCTVHAGWWIAHELLVILRWSGREGRFKPCKPFSRCTLRAAILYWYKML